LEGTPELNLRYSGRSFDGGFKKTKKSIKILAQRPIDPVQMRESIFLAASEILCHYTGYFALANQVVPLNVFPPARTLTSIRVKDAT
jgi:hypothetical protein